MAEPFIAEIRLFSFNYAPQGWSTCDGQTLQIMQNQALYSLIGNTYGGTSTTFNLPDLRGRTPVHPDNQSITRGNSGGAEPQTLTSQQMPAHIHQVVADMENGTSSSPAVTSDGGTWGASSENPFVIPGAGTTPVALNPSVIKTAGSGGGHSNMQPYITINFCIALTGLYPPRP